MKELKENPLTRELHAFWRAKIKKDLSLDSSFLSPILYVNTRPKEFYSKEAYSIYLSFLNNSEQTDPKLLSSILNDAESDLDRANAVLNQINDNPIHDTLLADDNIELIAFINSEIHFNLLRLYESGLAVLLSIVARFNRIKRGKGTDGLDLYNIVLELKGTDFSFIDQLYHNTVRNGIAHGKVVFTERSILYSDKKGNEEEIAVREIVRIFDNLLDVLNGFCLALKIFLFSATRNITVAKSILTEELQIACTTPGWKIIDCFESLAIGNRKQLTIYVRNRNWDFDKVNWYSFFTAYWAEYLTNGYERIFISLNSYPSLPGWAAFNGYKLRELRINKTTNLNDYKGVPEDNAIQFAPKYRFPQIFFKIGTFRNAFLISLELRKLKHREGQLNYVDVRDASFHSVKSTLVVPESSVVISCQAPSDCLKLIKTSHALLIRKVIKYAKTEISPWKIMKYFPVKYIRVFVYDTNERIRDLRHSGLTKGLIATIQLNVSKNIKVPDLVNSRIEKRGQYKIYWNKNWEHYSVVSEDK